MSRAETRRTEIQQELLGIPTRSTLIEPNAHWLTTEEACALLRSNISNGKALALLPHRSRSTIKTSSRGAGALYERAMLERVNAIRKRCGLRLVPAIRVLLALEKGGPL